MGGSEGKAMIAGWGQAERGRANAAKREAGEAW